MRALLRIRLPWLRLTVAALLAAATLVGAGRWVNSRVAAVAPERAVAGDSLAVVTLQQDWPRSVAPAALSAPGEAGERARNLANARLDLAIERSLTGEPESFHTVAEGLLTAIRDAREPLTRPGAAWGRWMTTRLLQASRSLETNSRLRLLNLADQTLAALPRKPRVRTPRPTAPPPEPTVATAIAVTPPPEPTLVEAPQPAEESLAESEDPPSAEEPDPFKPDWLAPDPEPILPRPAERVAHVEPPITALPDRTLLTRVLETVREVGPREETGPTVTGPTPAPRVAPEEPTEAELRLERLRAELTRRGYRSIGPEQIELLLSRAVADRISLAERLLVDRTSNSTRLRLLMLLAKDASAEVRAAAVSALASTADPALVRAALDLAMRDRDPRVGRLVSPLRARLR